MIFQKQTSEERHAKNKAQVDKWERSWADKREKLRPQWEAECEWHPWFAWHPVDIGNDRSAWLCMVERRLKYIDQMPTINAEWMLRDFIYENYNLESLRNQ